MIINRDSVLSAGVGVLALCAVVLTGLNVERRFFPPLSTPIETIANWREYADGGHRVGPKEAKVTVIVFSDYECPSCRALAIQLAALRARYSKDLAIVWRHFPLQGHVYAVPAARAAECAAEQGQFELYHRRLTLASGWASGGEQLPQLADSSGTIDPVRFRLCLASDRPKIAIERDVAAGRRLGVVATPTFLVDGAEYVGTPPDLDRIVGARVKNP